MPSFSGWKRSARDLISGPRGGSSTIENGNDARAHDRQSTRETLKGFIRRAKLAHKPSPSSKNKTNTNTNTNITVTGEGASQSAASRTAKTQSFISRPISGTTASTRPTVDPSNNNKPLPSPPLPETVDKSDGPPKNPVLKLDRIMATLTNAEIEKLFSGAPQYFARSQGYGTGAPHPSVAFPWDEDLRIRDLTDHTQIEDEAWGGVTAAPRLIQRDPLSATTPSGRKRPHFKVKTCERPNMLSMQGSEKGTIGYQAALELSVADALQEEQYGFDSLGSKSNVVVEQRQRLITSKDGLRQIDDAAVMEQLLKCEERYQGSGSENPLNAHEIYHELFAKVLHTPLKVIDENDPYSLAVQIHALVKVLATHNAWIDFSRVEWRIRLGQVLWGFPLDDELDDGSSINEGHDDQDRSEERYWLLVQILLSCELLIRLDAITEGDEFGGWNLKASDVHKFEKEVNVSVKWSLLLARTWLDNITISKTETPSSGTSTPKGWLTSLTNRMSLKHEHTHGAQHVDHAHHKHHGTVEHQYAIQGRYVERQVFGLTQFARKLRWPDIETYITRVSVNTPVIAQATPINSPLPTSDTQRSSYFGGDRRPVQLQRQPSRRRKIEAALHFSGWLSKSYTSGLVLPGEALSHFLMSTLLENDQEAMARLGPMANLCGGFVYGRKSFWSTACIVGRVLAAGRGSAECMGWVSADVLPEGLGDGWLDIDVADIPDDVAKTGKKARLWGKVAIERESDVLGDADSSNVLPADFIIPHENNHTEPPPSNIRVDLKSLDLEESFGSVRSTPTFEQETPFSEQTRYSEVQTYPASVSFTMTHDGMKGEQSLTVALAKDVYFVTSHPCAPSSRVKYFKSPTSPTIQQIDLESQDWNAKATAPAHIIGHPLHKYYTYKAVHLVDLLGRSEATLEDLLSTDSKTPTAGPPSMAFRGPRVLVIDCITGFAPPRSPEMASLSRMSSISSSFGLEPTYTVTQLQLPTPPREATDRPSTAASISSRVSRIDPPSPDAKMKLPTRRRQFGSDLEILVRALCAEKGWNALISRRRRGCLACAIREAGALGWKVVIRVE